MTSQPSPDGHSFVRRYWWIVGLVVAAAIVVILAPAASSDPDGLDRVSQDEEFADEADDAPYEFLADYSVPGINDEYWSVISAGLIGVAIVFIMAVLFGVLLRFSRKARAP